MACSLNQGFTPKTCKTPSGTMEFMITEYDNVTGVTNPSGVITAISMASGKFFRRYKQKPEIANWKENETGDAKSGTYKSEITANFDINSINTSDKVEAKVLLKNTVIMIAKDVDGTYWMLGQDFGIDVESIAWDGGVALSDFRGGKVTLKGVGATSVAEVTSGLIAGLLLPASP